MEKPNLNDQDSVSKKEVPLIDVIEGCQDIFRDKKIIIGFTGGLGSTLLVHLASNVCKELKCVFVDTKFTSPNDRMAVETLMTSDEFAAAGVIQIIVRPELSKDILILNPEDRDFFCKKAIAGALEEFREKLNYDFIADGTSFENFELFWNKKNDFGLNFKMVYGEGEVTEELLQQLAKHYSIQLKRPAETNLLSRFSYHIPITPELLENIAKSEDYITNLTGVSLVRVRILDEYHVIIEVPKGELDKILGQEIREKIISHIMSLGFSSISVDLSGYRRDNLLHAKRK